MRNVLVVGLAVALFIVACKGGPGTLPDQGPDQAGQGGGIQAIGSQNGAAEDNDDSDEEVSGGSKGSGSSTKPPQQSQNQPLSASSFDQSCEQDSDCGVVFEGNVCSVCLCPSAAIATKAQTEYATAFAQRRIACGTVATDVACSPCQGVAPSCNDKRCTAKKT